jgi:hypothetical protein
MRFHEIIIRKVERHRSFEVFQFFAECEREPREPFAVRPHSQIRPLNVGRANLVWIRVACDSRFVNCDQFGRAVLTLIFSVRGDGEEAVRIFIASS